MTNEALVGVGPDVESVMPTHELMSWLGDAERDRFVKMQETFETDGWRLIREYALAKITEHVVNGANAKSWDDTRAHLGARLAWDQVSKMDADFMNAFEQAALAAREEASGSQEDL